MAEPWDQLSARIRHAHAARRRRLPATAAHPPTQGVLNIAGVLFSSTLFMGITNCLTIQHLIAMQRTVFYRWVVGRGAWAPLSSCMLHEPP